MERKQAPERKPLLDQRAVQAINDILNRGNSVEIRPRANDVVVLEIKRQTRYSVPVSVQE